MIVPLRTHRVFPLPLTEERAFASDIPASDSLFLFYLFTAFLFLALKGFTFVSTRHISWHLLTRLTKNPALLSLRSALFIETETDYHKEYFRVTVKIIKNVYHFGSNVKRVKMQQTAFGHCLLISWGIQLLEVSFRVLILSANRVTVKWQTCSAATTVTPLFKRNREPTKLLKICLLFDASSAVSAKKFGKFCLVWMFLTRKN